MSPIPLSSTRHAQPGFPTWQRRGAPLAAISLVLAAGAALVAPAQAHHLLEITGLPPTPLGGLLSGLAHPVLGPDHLIFLLALSLTGLRQRAGWMLGLLACGLAGSLLGRFLPGAPFAEALVAFSLVVVGMVQIDRWPRALLLPAFTLHGYVLGAAVLGWTRTPMLAYMIGLLVSQGLLLLLALTLLRRLCAGLGTVRRQLLAAGLIGGGLAWTWSGLVG